MYVSSKQHVKEAMWANDGRFAVYLALFLARPLRPIMKLVPRPG